MSGNASTLLIPVENQVRELDAKLLLAAAAVEAGYPVVIGSRAFLHYRVADLPRGVYLAKSMRKASVRMFDILTRLGHAIVAWDEEGLVRPPDADYYDLRLHPETIAMTRRLFAWGEDNARVLAGYPAAAGVSMDITGNPRADLMRPELRGFYDDHVASIRDRFGDFILVNTNFGWVNHFFSDLSETDPIEADQGQSGQAGVETQSYYPAKVALKARLFGEFQKMLPELARAFPDINIVLRPHPSESHDSWRTAAAGLSNVYVISEGSSVPWIMASQALVSNSCTTAVEAAILGRRRFNYQPITDPVLDDPLPMAVSECVYSLDELIAGLATDVADAEADNARATALTRHVSALEGPLAADRMIASLSELGFAESSPAAASITDRLHGNVHVRLRNLVKAFNMRRSNHRNSLSYHAHRFPTVTAAELQQRIDRLGGLLGRFDGVRIVAAGEHLFRLWP